jgi:hypothetical protein
MTYFSFLFLSIRNVIKRHKEKIKLMRSLNIKWKKTAGAE